VLTLVAGSVAQGVNRPGLMTGSALIQGGLGCAVSLSLLSWIGFPGILIGTSAGLVVGGGWLVARVHRLLAVGNRDYLARVLAAPLGCGIAGLVGGFLLAALADRLLPQRGRPEEAIVLALVTLGFLVSYALALLRGRYFDEAERERIRSGLYSVFGRSVHAR
jgi:hypothetical protein